jgi:hypothetical protein
LWSSFQSVCLLHRVYPRHTMAWHGMDLLWSSLEEGSVMDGRNEPACYMWWWVGQGQEAMVCVCLSINS